MLAHRLRALFARLQWTISVVVATLTVVPGRAKTLHGGLHLVLFAGFLFLAANP
jgi:Ca2+/H+ antiporter